jgi:hypothetical protein
MNIYVRVRINVSSFISYVPYKYKASKTIGQIKIFTQIRPHFEVEEGNSFLVQLALALQIVNHVHFSYFKNHPIQKLTNYNGSNQ